jgi:hypothetical protein
MSYLSELFNFTLSERKVAGLDFSGIYYYVYFGAR